MSTNEAPKAVNYLTVEKPVHRDPLAILDELTAARTVLFDEMEPQVRDMGMARIRADVRVKKLKAAWEKENPDEPFDPTSFSPPAVVPPADPLIQRKFHRQHYVVAKLEAELEAAKKAESNV